MSYYKDIYNDFPLRCGKLWLELREQAKEKGLDVTFMLMTASAGLAAPYEHLKVKKREDDLKKHPAFHDLNVKHYHNVYNKIEKAIDAGVSDSPLLIKANLNNWHARKVDRLEQIRDTAEFRQMTGVELKIKKARQLIYILRNALAHNNIYAFKKSSDKDIDEIAFFAQDRKYDDSGNFEILGYDVLVMPVVEFEYFLDGWFYLLNVADPKGTCTMPVVTNLLSNDERFAA